MSPEDKTKISPRYKITITVFDQYHVKNVLREDVEVRTLGAAAEEIQRVANKLDGIHL